MNDERSDDRELREALVAALEDTAVDSAGAIAALRRRGRINRMLIWGVGVLAALALIMGAVLAWTIASVQHNNHRIEEVQFNTRSEVLCPLYGAFLAAKDNPVPDNIKNDPRQLKERMDAFEVVEAGSRELGCNDLE